MRLSGYLRVTRWLTFLCTQKYGCGSFENCRSFSFILFASRELLSIHSFLRGCSVSIAAAAIPLFSAYHIDRVLYIQQRRFKKPTEKKEGDNR